MLRRNTTATITTAIFTTNTASIAPTKNVLQGGIESDDDSFAGKERDKADTNTCCDSGDSDDDKERDEADTNTNSGDSDDEMYT